MLKHASLSFSRRGRSERGQPRPDVDEWPGEREGKERSAVDVGLV